MPRVRISKDGIDIAKPGYDVDSASLANMAFSSSLVAMRIALTGTTTPVAYTGFMDDRYKRSIVTYASSFYKPPLVLVAGLNGDGTTDQTPFLHLAAGAGEAWTLPLYEIRSYANKFELYTITGDYLRPSPATWRYWVFQNTLAD